MAAFERVFDTASAEGEAYLFTGETLFLISDDTAFLVSTTGDRRFLGSGKGEVSLLDSET